MRIFFSFGLALLVQFFCNSQVFSQSSDTSGLNTLINKTTEFSKKYPQEKVHVHFDKPYYSLSDTVWFKVYLTAGLHVPSPLSKIVYVDITNQRDSVIQSLKLPVNDATAAGYLFLDPKKYKQGNHRFRAYTRWMMNFGADYFFEKSIPVGNSEKGITTHIRFNSAGNTTTAVIAFKSLQGMAHANQKVSWTIGDGEEQRQKGKGQTDQNGELKIALPNSSLKGQVLNTTIEINEKAIPASFSLDAAGTGIDLQFFPESGNLVSGIPSKVAFKAINSKGLGVNVKGEITDQQGNIVNSFESSHLGMGNFMLVPQEGKTYTAKITSSARTYELPEVKPEGITISVRTSNSDSLLSARFLCNEQFFQSRQNRNFYIIAKVDENVFYAAQIKLSSQVFTLPIPKNRFPTGIVQITILDDTKLPLAERLVFVNHNDKLNLLAKTDKTAYTRRQKVRLSISSKAGNVPAAGSLSVSVVDEGKVKFDEDNEKSILSNLLLESNLQGFIEKPNYYFNQPTEKTAAELDLLMLTQGYRRFLYKDILAGNMPKIYFLPEQGIEITGILRNSTGMPLNKANVRLHIPDRYYTAYAVTNGSGVFKFSNLVLTDSSEVIISSADYSIKNPMLTVDPIDLLPQFSTGSKRPGEHDNIDSTMNVYLQNSNRVLRNSTLLADVVIKSTAKTEAPSHKDYPALSGLSAWPDHLVTKERIANCTSLITCISTLLPGVTVENEHLYITRAYNAGNRTPMQIFFNGMPVDYSHLNTINPLELENIEVFLKDELGLVNRMYSTNGVVALNSKKVEKSNMTLAQVRNMLPKAGEIKIRPQGYTISREFYSPRYTTPQSMTTGVDLRSTIYWNPSVKTDKTTGNSVVEFYNADGKGTYRVVVEGIDAEGHIGRTVYRYRVN